MKEKIPESPWRLITVVKREKPCLSAWMGRTCPAASPGLSIFQALLLGVGLQHKSVDQLEKEIELPAGQLMGLFNRIIRKVVKVPLAKGGVVVPLE